MTLLTGEQKAGAEELYKFIQGDLRSKTTMDDFNSELVSTFRSYIAKKFIEFLLPRAK